MQVRPIPEEAWNLTQWHTYSPWLPSSNTIRLHLQEAPPEHFLEKLETHTIMKGRRAGTSSLMRLHSPGRTCSGEEVCTAVVARRKNMVQTSQGGLPHPFWKHHPCLLCQGPGYPPGVLHFPEVTKIQVALKILRAISSYPGDDC